MPVIRVGLGFCVKSLIVARFRRGTSPRPINIKVKPKPFQVGELVWKTILPLGTKSNKFGKWSPV